MATFVYQKDIIPKQPKQSDYEKFTHSKLKYKWAPEEVKYTEKYCEDHEFRKDLTVYFDGYIQYLTAAYYNDCGIEIAPWFIWNVILKQISDIVNDEPERYRNIFTKSKGKEEIRLNGKFDVVAYANKIKELFPDKKKFDIFFPDWGTKMPEKFMVSMYGLFAEATKEYYRCCVISCCIPKIRVLGNDEDWNKLYEHVSKLDELFNNNYTHKIKPYISMISKNWNKSTTWKNFYVMGNGCGGPREIRGDVTMLLKSGSATEGSEEMMSRFPFNDDGLFEFAYLSGMIGGKIEDGFLVPVYDTAFVMSLEQPKIEDIEEKTECDEEEIEIIHNMEIADGNGKTIDVVEKTTDIDEGTVCMKCYGGTSCSLL